VVRTPASSLTSPPTPAAVPVASIRAVKGALASLAGRLGDVLTEGDIDLPLATSHHVAETFRALGLIDGWGTVTVELANLVRGRTSLAQVLSRTHADAVAVVRAGGPIEVLDAILAAQYPGRTSWTRTRALIVAALADDGVDVRLYRSRSRKPIPVAASPSPTHGPTDERARAATSADEHLLLELDLYTQRLQTAIEGDEFDVQTRLSKRTAALRAELRRTTF
jgi:hypothetical protein